MIDANLSMDVGVNIIRGVTGEDWEVPICLSGSASGITWTVGTADNSNYDLHGNTAYFGKPVYYGSPIHWGDPHPQQESPRIRVVPNNVEVPAPEPQNDRKEKTDMLNRQTFLDALADEGKVIAPEGRDIIRDADAGKLELLFARLLARAFETADLAMLKEKPKEVLVTTKEA